MCCGSVTAPAIFLGYSLFCKKARDLLDIFPCASYYFLGQSVVHLGEARGFHAYYFP